jgi:hypothetical protein
MSLPVTSPVMRGIPPLPRQAPDSPPPQKPPRKGKIARAGERAYIDSTVMLIEHIPFLSGIGLVVLLHLVRQALISALPEGAWPRVLDIFLLISEGVLVFNLVVPKLISGAVEAAVAITKGVLRVAGLIKRASDRDLDRQMRRPLIGDPSKGDRKLEQELEQELEDRASIEKGDEKDELRS